MNITNSERIADDLKWEIRKGLGYSANPVNEYHEVYQSMINRVFFVFLVFMVVLALVLTYGMAKGIGMFLAGLATGAVLLLFGHILFVCTKGLVSFFCYWIRGY